MYFRSVQLKVTKTNEIDYFCVDERFIQYMRFKYIQIHMHVTSRWIFQGAYNFFHQY